MRQGSQKSLVVSLVLNFDMGMETLAETSFFFDIDRDNEYDTLPGLVRGSGFLDLDLDDDQEITSGLELFGPASVWIWRVAGL